jgi:UV DNA damage endonuclease
MVFDNHHHAVREKLATYEDPGVAAFTAAARDTWPDPAWHLVHLSNGKESFADPRHSDLITAVPSAFLAVPWVEVEAKGKEDAINALRGRVVAPTEPAPKPGGSARRGRTSGPRDDISQTGGASRPKSKSVR